jgi:hypothetical protein
MATLEDTKAQFIEWKTSGYLADLLGPASPLGHLWAFCERQNVYTPDAVAQRIKDITQRLSPGETK